MTQGINVKNKNFYVYIKSANNPYKHNRNKKTQNIEKILIKPLDKDNI